MRAPVLTSARARYSDFAAVFAIRSFAIYQTGNILMTVGFWMQRIAIGWVTWELTGSEFWLGLIAFAELFPSLLTAVLGGQLADRHPSTRVMFWGQIASALVSLALAVLYALSALTPNMILWVMVFLGAVSGGILPARLAMASWLAPRALLPTALAVNSTGFNLSRFVGPALAAGLLLISSATVVFLCALAGFLAFAWALHLIRDTPRQGGGVPTGAVPVSTPQVMRDLWATPVILGVIALQLVQGILIRPASELFPAYATTIFNGGETALGLLNAAVGLGAVAGALALSKARENRAALVQIFAMSVVFALSLLAFSTVHTMWLALVLLFIYGLTMSSSNIAALSFVQLNTPQDRLGRVLSLYTIVFRVGPALGAFLFGGLAEHISLEVAGFGFGALGLVITVLIGVGLVRIRH
jgi:MFS family permease